MVTKARLCDFGAFGDSIEEFDDDDAGVEDVTVTRKWR